MKVKDLIYEIDRLRHDKNYPNFLEYDIYLEQCSEGDKAYKRKPSPEGQGWHFIRTPEFPGDLEQFWDEYFKSEALGLGVSKEKKVAFISINF